MSHEQSHTLQLFFFLINYKTSSDSYENFCLTFSLENCYFLFYNDLLCFFNVLKSLNRNFHLDLQWVELQNRVRP